jgi:cytochrome c oxidase cbb3-type subunit 3
MLARAMRVFGIVILLVLLAIAGVILWISSREPTNAEASEIASVLAPTGSVSAPPAYAHCASCHLHDGSGRPDGSIPRLNGQRRAILEHKLFRLRAGMTRLPVMDPFARTLQPAEVGELARYLSELPDTPAKSLELTDEERMEGATLYSEHCASCHGARGEGHDGLFASRLCGQYAGYLERRLQEVRDQTRGDADAVMKAVVDGLPEVDLSPVVHWLAAGKGCSAP